jgi:hypothetical protein
MSTEAAYHEAAHAVLAAKAKYHSIVGGIDLGASKSGVTYVSLSRSKCLASDMPVQSAARNAMVVRELVRILCSGYAAELVAKEKGIDLLPNMESSKPDYAHAQQQLRGMGLPAKLNDFQRDAIELVRDNWSDVEKIALVLKERKELDASEVLEMLGIAIP